MAPSPFARRAIVAQALSAVSLLHAIHSPLALLPEVALPVFVQVDGGQAVTKLFHAARTVVADGLWKAGPFVCLPLAPKVADKGSLGWVSIEPSIHKVAGKNGLWILDKV